MTAYTPQYRLTLYEPRSLDSAETTILQGDGTVHSDDFKVITKTGVAGWQPYLDPPKGRKGRIDLLSRKTDVGKLAFQILDKRTTEGGSNLSRWLSGFLGAGGSTIPGKVQLGGCKGLVEESTDDGSTWTTFFTGRVTTCALVDKVTYQLDLIGLAADLLTARAFQGRPHSSITYACEPCLMPLGPSIDYAGLPAVTGFTGTINTSSFATNAKSVYLAAASIGDPYNVITAGFIDAFGVPPVVNTLFGTASRWVNIDHARLRVRLTYSSTTYEYVLLGFRGERRNNGFYNFTELWIHPVDTDDPLYGTTPADTSAVTEVRILPARTEPSPDRPLLLADVHPVQLLADLLDGKFSNLEVDGTVSRTYPRDSASFATLIADATFPTVRFQLTEAVKLVDWIPTYLLKPYGLALYENGSGNLVVVDVRPPTSVAGVTTLTDVDLTGKTVGWEWDRSQSFGVVEVHTYAEAPALPGDFTAYPGPFPALPAGLAAEAKQTTLFELGTLLDGDFNERKYTIDATGMRAMGGDTQQARDRGVWVAAWASTLALQIAKPFGAGPVTVTAECRRTSNVTGLVPGGLVILDSDQIPDPSTNLRGGTQVARVLEKSEAGVTITLRCLILGPATTASVPVLGALGAGTDAEHEVTAALTVNANSDPLVVHVAITDTATGSAPAEASALWTFAYRATASATVTLRELPSGERVWVRARSEPNPKKADTTLPSAWVFSTGTDYRDTTAITAPSSLATSGVTAKSARLTWSIGSVTEYGVRVYLASGANSGAASAATAVPVIDLPPGTTYFDLWGLDAGGPWYKPEVCFFDLYGGESARATLGGTTFEATGTNTPAPQPVAISVYPARSRVTALASPQYAAAMLPMGVPLIVTPAGPGFGILIERAPDSGGSPGSWADLVEIADGEQRDQGFLYADTTAAGTTTYWYRARHVQPGFDDSDPCDAISGSAQPLPVGWDGAATIYPLNRQQAMTDGGFAVKAEDDNGEVIDVAVTKTDGAATRSLVTGVQSGTAQNGDVITFSPAFQSVPKVFLSGGILHEPSSLWGPIGVGDGSETDPYDDTLPTYENFAALSLTEAGFTLRARLRQKGATVTGRGDDFPGSNSLDAAGENTEVTVANAPSNNDEYTVNLQTEIVLESKYGAVVTGTLVVLIQSNTTGPSTWTTHDTVTHIFSTNSMSPDTDTVQHSRTVAIAGLSSSEKIRLYLDSFSVSGVAQTQTCEVNGFDGTLGSPANGVEYNTSTDSYASKTPEADDFVTWVAMGVQ